MSAPTPQPDPLTEVSAALDANPFADPVRYFGKSISRAHARKPERHLQGVRRGVGT